MGMFGDLFGGEAQRRAAEASRGFLDQTLAQGRGDTGWSYAQGRGDLQTGATNAGTAVMGGYGAGRGAVIDASGRAINYLDTGTAGAFDRLTGGFGQAAGAYAPLQGLAGKYGAGTSLLLDSFGANGPEGNARATSAFTASPGYSFNLDQGLDAINRRRAAGGMLASGNADRDAQIFGSGLASNEYGNWRAGLGQFVNPELAATQGAASGLGGLWSGLGMAGANLAYGSGAAKAGVATGAGKSLSDLYAHEANTLGGINTGLGMSLANLATTTTGQRLGQATSLAPQYAQSYKNQADAETAGSANLWNSLFGLGNAGLKLYGAR